MVNNSTDYYRQNRRVKRIKYQCPHCNYCTHNCRITLTNHINSKHKTENQRPFQCTECDRGFSQKAHLIRHLECEHNITNDIRHSKVTTLLFIIKLTDKIPRSKKTKARRDYYSDHLVVKSRDIFNKHHEYLPGVFLKNHDIHYDRRNGFIEIHKIALKEGFHFGEKPYITVNI